MFLYTKENTLSPELCRAFIDTFEASDEKKPGVLYGPDGHSSDTGKKSTDLTFNPGYLSNPTWGPLLTPLVSIVEREQMNYVIRHQEALTNLDPFRLDSHFNMQKYDPNGGFFQWHCERASLGYLNRVLVWMVYLNTVTDRGETEFYYQHHFEQPVAGKMVIWPSDWTYLHRGVSSPTQTKYILTGWLSHYNDQK
jgi:hypothetical protein